MEQANGLTTIYKANGISFYTMSGLEKYAKENGFIIVGELKPLTHKHLKIILVALKTV